MSMVAHQYNILYKIDTELGEAFISDFPADGYTHSYSANRLVLNFRSIERYSKHCCDFETLPISPWISKFFNVKNDLNFLTQWVRLECYAKIFSIPILVIVKECVRMSSNCSLENFCDQLFVQHSDLKIETIKSSSQQFVCGFGIKGANR